LNHIVSAINISVLCTLPILMGFQHSQSHINPPWHLFIQFRRPSTTSQSKIVARLHCMSGHVDEEWHACSKINNGNTILEIPRNFSLYSLTITNVKVASVMYDKKLPGQKNPPSCLFVVAECMLDLPNQLVPCYNAPIKRFGKLLEENQQFSDHNADMQYCIFFKYKNSSKHLIFVW